MNKYNENKLVPKLRFSEFKNNGEWKESILNLISPAIFDGTHQTPSYTEKGIPFFSVENLISGNKNKYISKEDYLLATIKNKPEKGDIIITRIGNIGTSKLVDWDYEFSVYVTLAIVKQSQIFDSYYLHCYFQSSRYQKEIKSKALLNAVPCKINMDELRRTKILLPPDKDKNEQKKIATCFSTLDDIIKAESHKLNTLLDHKNGLLQSLLTQEGETVPKFRFKDFKDCGDWVEKSLGDVAEIITGNTPPTNNLSSYGGNKLFVSPADISATRYIVQTKTTLTEKGFAITRHIKENSVLFVCIGSTIGKVAQNKFECATNQQINSLIPYKGYSSDFLYSILDSNSVKIASLAGRHAVPLINKTSFSAIKLRFPVEFLEQQKIAQCLSSIDEFINTQSQKVDALKLFKKGLLQVLIP